MTDSDGPPASGTPAAGPQGLAQDWITLVQSELSALAADRETAETWQAMLAIWAGAASSVACALPAGGHDTRTADAPRPAPAAAASDSRDAEIERLGDRIAELERRLANLDGGT